MSSPGCSATSDESASSYDIRMEGYLFKRTSNTFKTWVRYVRHLPDYPVHVNAFCMADFS